MHRSVPRSAILLLLAVSFSACSMLGLGGKKPAKPPTAAEMTPAGTLLLTPKLRVRTLVKTPPGFMPIPDEPPMWLRHGTEIGVAGKIGGVTKVIGFSGQGHTTKQIIAADGGPGAPQGKIVGVAPSPDGMTLAVAEYQPGRIRINLRYLISTKGENSVASFDGAFRSVDMRWVTPGALLVGLTAASGTSQPDGGSPDADGAGLFIIHVIGAVTVERIKVSCPLSPLAFSPDGRFIIGQGGGGIAPMIFDRRTGKCEALATGGPIKVLSWAPKNKNFLYAALPTKTRGPGVFRYPLALGSSDLVAVSSGAAIYTRSGSILALGNRNLSFKAAMAAPNQNVIAELATLDPGQTKTRIESLGTPTTPAMMMSSRMVYTPGLAEIALELFALHVNSPIREIVTYSIPDRKAFVLARGPVDGTVTLGWAPGVNQLAICSGDGHGKGALVVISPPR